MVAEWRFLLLWRIRVLRNLANVAEAVPDAGLIRLVGLLVGLQSRVLLVGLHRHCCGLLIGFRDSHFCSSIAEIVLAFDCRAALLKSIIILCWVELRNDSLLDVSWIVSKLCVLGSSRGDRWLVGHIPWTYRAISVVT